MSKSSTSPAAAQIDIMRGWIAAAGRESVPVEEMLLRLTVRDASTLKRHPNVAMEEVSFKDGEMRFLGVRVLEGGVVTSVLERGAV